MKPICEWHNYPIHNCSNVATRFFKSNWPAPNCAHRAICESCYVRFKKLPGPQEVSYDEWKTLGTPCQDCGKFCRQRCRRQVPG